MQQTLAISRISLFLGEKTITDEIYSDAQVFSWKLAIQLPMVNLKSFISRVYIEKG